MKLVSMTDYVLSKDVTIVESKFQILRYAEFLKQPLELWMFVPCDEKNEPLFNLDNSIFPPDVEEWNEYKQAKERVLFEGFVFTESQKYSCVNKVTLSVSPYGLNDEKIQITKIKENGNFHTWLKLDTVEDLVQCDLTLSQTAINQLK